MAQYDTIWYTRCPVPTATGIAADLGWLGDEFAADGISREEAANYHYTHALRRPVPRRRQRARAMG